MAGIADTLSRHKVVGLDTSVFIYQLEGILPHAGATTDLFRLIQGGNPSAVTSVMTVTELMTKPLRLGQTNTADDYERLLLDFPNLTILNVDLPIARIAASFRARYRLRSTDAIQLASSLIAGATAFVTNDAILRRIRELAVIFLDDFAEV